jgi:hypothetical protein
MRDSQLLTISIPDTLVSFSEETRFVDVAYLLLLAILPRTHAREAGFKKKIVWWLLMGNDMFSLMNSGQLFPVQR